MKPNILGRLFALVILIGCGTACATESEPIPVAVDSLPAVDLEYFLVELEMFNPSARQREAVVDAVESGEMSYEVIEELFLNYVECLEDSGFTVEFLGPIARYEGFFEPEARFYFPEHVTEDQAFDLDRQCLHRHYGVAMGFYVSQPRTLELYLDTFETQREYILDCLSERGVEVESDATRVELLYAVSENYYRNLGEPVCWEGSGFGAFLPPDVDPFDLLSEQFQD